MNWSDWEWMVNSINTMMWTQVAHTIMLLWIALILRRK